MKQHITAVYNQEEIVRVFRSFAYAKLLATQSRVENYRGLFFEPWIVTRTEIVQPWRSREELARLINEEVKIQRDHLLKLLSSGHGPAVLHQFMKSLRKATLSFFEAYRMMEAENSQINEDAAYVLGISQRSAAVARACADISLAWIGLLSGPAVIGWNLASRRFILYQAEATMPFIVRKLAVGLTGAFGTKLAESWEQAASADFLMVQVQNNTPGFVDDSWKIFFAALNAQVDRTLVTAYRNEVGQLGQATTNLYGMSLGDPRIEQAAARRNALMNSARTAGGRLNAMDRVTPVLSTLGGGVKFLFKAAAYGLTIKATGESLVLLRDQWQLDTRK